MSNQRLPVALAITSLLMSVWGCDYRLQDASGSNAVEPGEIRFHLEAANDDVSGFCFEIGVLDDSVIDVFETTCKGLKEMAFPNRLLPEAGDVHYFADAYFVLEPGDYLVRAIPMVGEDPSTTCRATDWQEVGLTAGETIEVFLLSQCDCPNNSGLDIVVLLNHCPLITDLVFDPSKFVLACEELVVSAIAMDPDGDDLTFEWTLLEAPEGALYELEPMGDSLNFMSRTGGDYLLRVTATDPFGRSASMDFPVHSILTDDVNENGVGDECELRDSGRVVTILLTMSNPRIADPTFAPLLAVQAVTWVSPVPLPEVLVVRDDNHNNEFPDDVDFVHGILAGEFSAVLWDEPADGLTIEDLQGFDVVWFSNPGYPVDDLATAHALLQFLDEGGGVVLQGDDITQGADFLMEPLTHLSYVDNGTSYCGQPIDNNTGMSYRVEVETNGHPVIAGALEGMTVLYGDDIDTSFQLEEGEVVLAWATLDPPWEDDRCEPEPCPYKPAAVAFDPKDVP